MIEFSGEHIIQWFGRRWEQRSTIIVLLLCVFFALIWKFTDSSLSDLTLGESGFLLVCLVIIYLLWHISTAIPRAPKGRVGFAIAISCEGEKEKEKIAADFVAAIRKLLARGRCGTLFYLVEIPEHYAKRITDNEMVTRIRRRARCHFIVYGSAKLREIDGRDKHVLDLEVQVAHQPVPKKVSRELSREMSEIFPRRVHIDTKNDLFSFEFTSEWVDCVARYIIGIAASLSGDLDYAESLFLDLYGNRHFKDSPLPHLKKLRDRTPIRLGEIYAYRASLAYDAWRRDHNLGHIDEMGLQLAQLRKFYPEKYAGRLLNAIYYFLKERNIEAAVREVRKCRDIRDATWRFSYAFLLGYSGRMTKARRMYRSAFQHHYDRADVPIQSEEFMHWLLEEEQDKVQLHFCLGLLNWHAKGDLQKALEDFEHFLASDGVDKFPEELRLAKSYVQNLKAEIKKQNKNEVEQ